jgi:hypothetical protein
MTARKIIRQEGIYTMFQLTAEELKDLPAVELRAPGSLTREILEMNRRSQKSKEPGPVIGNR